VFWRIICLPLQVLSGTGTVCCGRLLEGASLYHWPFPYHLTMETSIFCFFWGGGGAWGDGQWPKYRWFKIWLFSQITNFFFMYAYVFVCIKVNGPYSLILVPRYWVWWLIGFQCFFRQRVWIIPCHTVLQPLWMKSTMASCMLHTRGQSRTYRGETLVNTCQSEYFGKKFLWLDACWLCLSFWVWCENILSAVAYWLSYYSGLHLVRLLTEVYYMEWIIL
jgi:hypothetical protein